VVVGIIFPTSSLYITNRPGISNVPGVVVPGVLTNLSATSQEVVPEEGRSTIGTLSFDAVDLLEAITAELRDQLLVELRGVRGRDARVYTGDTDDFTDGSWQRVETYVIDGLSRRGRSFSFTCSDRSREQRVDIFDQKKTRLAATLAVGATSVQVTSTTGFSMLAHNSAYTDAPSSTVGYLLVRQTGELIRYTGTSGGNTFTGCTRGVFNTVEQECVVEAGVGADRRPEIEEFIYLEGSAAALDYAIKTGNLLENLLSNGGGELGTVGAQALGWTLLAGNALVVATDYCAVGGRSLKITNAGVTDSSSWQDVSLIGGAKYVIEGLIRTSALPAADAGFGAVINCNIQSGIGSFTIHEKTTIGADPSAAQPDCGIQADGLSRGWTYVRSVFTPASSGVLRVYCQLGGSGGQSGTAWFDGIRLRRLEQMPTSWHMGISESYVNGYAYDALGIDLFNDLDPTYGLLLRFTHLKKTDGKRFCEEQLHVPMQTFAPIDANGVLGIRRVTPMLADAAATAVLDPSTVISFDAIEYELARVVNRVIVNWNYDGEDYTRRELFIHRGSVAKHGLGSVMEFSLRGLTVQRHSRETVSRIVNSIFERRAAPPISSTLRLSRAMNGLEVGDTPRLTLPSVPDFTDADTLNRTVEIVSRRINWLTGQLHARVFGSTERMLPDPLLGSSAILLDTFYNAAGVALNTVLTMVGNAVTANGALTGNVDLRSGVYYHLGDLTINAGVTVTISNNVQLRIRGTLTINGRINGVGGGMPGLASPDVVAQRAHDRPVNMSTTYNGFFGSTQSSAGIYTSSGTGTFYSFGGNTQVGSVMSAPLLGLTVVAGGLFGLPADLRGTRGAWGPPVASAGQNGTVVAVGGNGGAGGAGLMIISRGTVAFGVSGEIDLSGANGTSPPATGVLGGVTAYGGAGAGGAPGCLYVILDGNTIVEPDLENGFEASQGLTPLLGTPAQFAGVVGGSITFPTQPATGVEPGFSGTDHWRAAHQIQYVPAIVELGAADESVPPPSALVASDSDVGVHVTWTSPAADRHDFIEVWRATTNDRTGAVRVFRGRADMYFETSETLVARYFWVRAGSDRYGFSSWHPLSSTGGVVATYGGATAVDSWTPIVSGNLVRHGTVYTKTTGAAWGDASVRSAEGFRRAGASFVVQDLTSFVMLGLDTNPAEDDDYDTIDHAWYHAGTVVQIYESGVGPIYSVAATIGSRLSVLRDNVSVRYYINGFMVREIAVAPVNVSLDSSFYFGTVGQVAFFELDSVSTNLIDPNAAEELVSSQPADGTHNIPFWSTGGSTTYSYEPITSVSWGNPTGETVDVMLRLTGKFALNAADAFVGRKIALRWTLTAGAVWYYDGLDVSNPNIVGTTFEIRGTQIAAAVGPGNLLQVEAIAVIIVPPFTSVDPADIVYSGLSLTVEALKR
jgi:hypothetical protein